ncbi:MAG: oxygenase MpaB family protein [Pseudomonadota bacterium]
MEHSARLLTNRTALQQARDVVRDIVFKPVERHLDEEAKKFLGAAGPSAPDFSLPVGEPALAHPEALSWRIFKNPVTLFIGGIAAVLLEFAYPAVREGVWRHSNFRIDPVGRLRRTGLAAMVTVYGPQSVARRMIKRVNAMHANVSGITDDGLAYNATDPDLLDWVQATANFGFLEAYATYASAMTPDEKDTYYKEARPSAALYGAFGAPASLEAQGAFIDNKLNALESSPQIFEFIDIIRHAPALPAHMRPSQRVFLRAAIDILPEQVRRILDLEGRGLRPFEHTLVSRLARRADRLCLVSGPPAQSCRRLGLPADWLYERERTGAVSLGDKGGIASRVTGRF